MKANLNSCDVLVAVLAVNYCVAVLADVVVVVVSAAAADDCCSFSFWFRGGGGGGPRHRFGSKTIAGCIDSPKRCTNCCCSNS